MDGIETWNCCGQLHSAGAKCRVCGKRKGGDTAAGAENTELKRADQLALEQAVKIARGILPKTAKLRVTITRGYRGTPLDGDNLVGGCKPLRDEIARLLDRDDAERCGIDWQYRQGKGSVRMVEIEEVI